MLDDRTIETIARAYHMAEKNRQQTRPPSVVYPGFTAEDAYAVQRKWVQIKLGEGNRIKGHKIGLTSRAMQRQANITEPDYGALMEDMFYQDGAQIPISRFIQPRLECELGFVIGRPLHGPDCTIFDVLDATDYVVPAAEIVDGRSYRVDPETNTPRCVFDSIADNAGNAAVVVGGRPVRPMDVDLRWVAALCYRNGIIEESGVAAAVLNHPANGIAWLANKLAPFGITLEPGQFVLSGSFTGVVAARAGDQFHIDYGPLGSISCCFAEAKGA
jgi:2-oxo-hept-3-ene-1,7-dioate hydratase